MSRFQNAWMDAVRLHLVVIAAFVAFLLHLPIQTGSILADPAFEAIPDAPMVYEYIREAQRNSGKLLQR